MSLNQSDLLKSTIKVLLMIFPTQPIKAHAVGESNKGFFRTKTTTSRKIKQRKKREIHKECLTVGEYLSVRRWTRRCQPQSLFKWFTDFSFTLTFPLSCIILLFHSLSLSRSQRMRLPVTRSFICVCTARNVHPPLLHTPLVLLFSSPNPAISRRSLGGNINLIHQSIKYITQCTSRYQPTGTFYIVAQ